MKKIKEIGYTFLIVMSMVASLFCIHQVATANAAPVPYGCQDDLWWTLQATRRIICDGPMFPDGHWNRLRIQYTPAHQVPFTCYGGRYYSSCSGGYFVDYQEAANEVYPVTPETKLPDEPGYLGDSTAQ